MRVTLNRLVGRLASSISLPEPIYEFGAYQVPGQEGRSIRNFFQDKEYIGSDMREGDGVDVILDLEKLDLPDESVGTAIAIDTFEHVREVWRATDELYRVLKPGGVVLFTSVMYFPIHAYPSDYWRFTPEAFRVLAQDFPVQVVEGAGLEDFPHTVVALCAKGPVPDEMAEALQKVVADWKKNDSQTWKEWATLLLPPVMLGPMYRLFNRVSGVTEGA